MINFYMDYEEIVSLLVKKDQLDIWLNIKPKIFYKDSKPYGLIGIVEYDGILHIASQSKSDELPFTVGMLRYLIKLSKENSICLITDNQLYQEHITKVLKRYGCRFEIKDNVLYSYGGI